MPPPPPGAPPSPGCPPLPLSVFRSQEIAGYYFAEARLQTVSFQEEGGEGKGSVGPVTGPCSGAGRVRFDFYFDPSEPLNSENLYQNINPEVIACAFPE